MEKNLDIQKVDYTNSLEFNGRKLTFKNKRLWDITDKVPTIINESVGGWWVKGKLLTKLIAKSLIKQEQFSIDLTGIQWHIQEQIKEGYFWSINN